MDEIRRFEVTEINDYVAADGRTWVQTKIHTETMWRMWRLGLVTGLVAGAFTATVLMRVFQ